MAKYRVIERSDGSYRMQKFMFGLFWKSKACRYGWFGDTYYDYEYADDAISDMNRRIEADRARALKKIQPRYKVIAHAES